MQCAAGVRAGRRSRPGAARPWPASSAPMSKCAASVYRIASPPGSTARRSGFRPGRSMRSMWPASRQRSMHQRRPGRRDAAVGHAGGLQQLRHRAGGARRARAPGPSAAARRAAAPSSSSAPAATWAARKPSAREPPVGEVAHRQADAADAEDSPPCGVRPWPRIISVRAAADVDHQPRLVGGLQVGHAGVDQARLLAAGDDLDRVAQRLLGAQQEGVAVARLAQRLRGHGAHLRRARSRPAAARSAAGRPGRAAPLPR